MAAPLIIRRHGRRGDAPREAWAQRRDIVLTILGGAAIAWLLATVLGRLSHPLVLLVLAALLAYAVAPAVAFFARAVPRLAAILLVYLLLLGSLGLVFYLVVDTAVAQARALVPTIQALFAADSGALPPPFAAFLERLGLSPGRIAQGGQMLAAWAERLVGGVVPVLQGTFASLFDFLVVVILSIYLLLDGARLVRWLRQETPHSVRKQVAFLLDTLARVVGGYVRGQLLLAALLAVLIGGGMALLHVPDALLLGLLAFVLAFVPILGTITSGAACVLLALSHGWVTAGLVLAYFVVMHVLEGDILGPRIVGGALGLHPVVSLLAVITGAELFGVVGALLAAPVTGLALAILGAVWSAWKESHPREFTRNKQAVVTRLERTLADEERPRSAGA